MERLLLCLTIFVFLFHKPIKAQLKVTKVAVIVVSASAKLLSRYFNPFTTYIHGEFSANEKSNAGIEMYNMALIRLVVPDNRSS